MLTPEVGGGDPADEVTRDGAAHREVRVRRGPPLRFDRAEVLKVGAGGSAGVLAIKRNSLIDRRCTLINFCVPAGYTSFVTRRRSVADVAE